MKDVFVATSNFQRFQETYKWLSLEQYGVDMAMVLGRAGRGKTTAARRIYAMNGANGIYVRYEERFSHVGLLREITFAAAGVKYRSTDACFAALSDALEGQRKVIMVDEIDRPGLRHLNMLRDLHDVCRTPVILIGEEPLEAKMNQERRLISRTRDILRFGPVAQMDVLIYYKEALERDITPEMASKLAAHAQGDFRNVIKDALRIEQIMKVNELEEITDAVIVEVVK